MNRAYLTSKKIHRIVLFAFIALMLIMAATGLLLKYFQLAVSLNLNLDQLRFIHNSVSPLFSLLLLVMTATGLSMYIIPLLRKK